MKATLSVIRRLDDDDKAAIQAAAIRFCKRHNIKVYDGDAWRAAHEAADAAKNGCWHGGGRLAYYWQNAFCQ